MGEAFKAEKAKLKMEAKERTTKKKEAKKAAKKAVKRAAEQNKKTMKAAKTLAKKAIAAASDSTKRKVSRVQKAAKKAAEEVAKIQAFADSIDRTGNNPSKAAGAKRAKSDAKKL